MSKVMNRVKKYGRMFKETFHQWNEREPFQNSAIIAYYTIFSLPGLLVIIVNVAGYFYGAEAVTHSLSGQIGGIVGGNTAKDIQDIIANATRSDGTVLSTILSVATLLFGATGVFYQLQQILNKMWEVKPKPKQMILKLIRDRIFSFGLILVVGFLLLVSLALSAALSAVSDWVRAHVADALLIVFNILDIMVSVGVITILFAAIFKFLPDARIRWKDVWHGAILTSILFVIAKYLLGVYFGNSDPGSTYGAAGSIILILLWVTYASMILLFGAEFTQVYAKVHGRKIAPTEGAESTEGKTDNGAINKKKTEAESKMVARQKAGSGDQTPEARHVHPANKKDDDTVGFGKLMLYLVISKIKKVL